jgi:hypothetical protein
MRLIARTEGHLVHQGGEVLLHLFEQDEARDEALRASFQPTRVEIPKRGQDCHWRSPTRPDREYFGIDELMLERRPMVA